MFASLVYFLVILGIIKYLGDILFKVTATDIRYFARSKRSRGLVHIKYFNLIWKVVFKLEYLFCQERHDTFEFEFEWTRRKVASNNNSR